MSTSNPKWNKRWLFDSTVEVPKSTKWRRTIAFNNLNNDEEIVDVRGEFATEVIELGSNTSPFKKQKTLGDCLPSRRNKTCSSKECYPEKNFNSSSSALPTSIQTEEGVMASTVCTQSPSKIMQDQYLVDGEGELDVIFTVFQLENRFI